VHEDLGELPVGGVEDATEGGARDLHPPRRRLLVEALVVSEADRLELVETHDDPRLLGGGSPLFPDRGSRVRRAGRGLEQRRARSRSDLPAAGASRHRFSSGALLRVATI
jgi:hypothetical protein